jgi:hypothetical protein
MEKKQKSHMSDNLNKAEKNAAVVVYEKYAPPKEEGVHYRLMCLTGEKKGRSYVLKSERVIKRGSEIYCK